MDPTTNSSNPSGKANPIRTGSATLRLPTVLEGTGRGPVVRPGRRDSACEDIPAPHASEQPALNTTAKATPLRAHAAMTGGTRGAEPAMRATTTGPGTDSTSG